jgi:hypothetical protein
MSKPRPLDPYHCQGNLIVQDSPFNVDRFDASGKWGIRV